ncbi:lysosome-associated membrane glycoprotein 2-like [Branchiostoma floridae x Branchiostoma belcheri]
MAWLAWLTFVALSFAVKSHEWVPARPPVGHFAVSDADNTTCLLMTVGMTFHVPYVKNDSNNTEVVASYHLPADADATGSCEDTSASITLSWGEGFNVTVRFERNDTMFYGSDITTGYVLNRDVFPDCKDDGETRVQSGPPHDVHAMPGRSYLCDVAVNVTVGNVTVTFSDLQVQPFLVKGGNFSKAEECSADMTTTPSAHTIRVKTTDKVTTPGPSNMTTPMTTIATLPPPRPVPDPSTLNFTLTDDEKKICFMALMGVQIEVNYTTNDKKKSTARWNVPKSVTVTGECSNTTTTLTLSFDGELTVVTMTFRNQSGKGGTVNKFMVSDIDLQYVTDKSHFPDAQPAELGKHINISKGNLTVFKGELGSSYLCKRGDNVTLNQNVTLRMIEVHVQPFGLTSNKFDQAEVCEADNDVTTLRPIIVGCAIAGVDVLMLMYYGIGRRMRRNKNTR